MVKKDRKQTLGPDFRFGDFHLSYLESIVLASFFPETKELTIKKIQNRCSYSYERVNSALKQLTEKNIVTLEEKGKTLIYSVNLDNPYSETIGFGWYMLERKINFMKKHKIIFKAIKGMKKNQYILSIVLFGSYSKNTETKNSDIDLLIICIPGKEKETENFIKTFTTKYGFNFSPVVLSMEEFPKIKKENKELWTDLKKYGIVFKGNDYFYWRVYKE